MEKEEKISYHLHVTCPVARERRKMPRELSTIRRQRILVVHLEGGKKRKSPRAERKKKKVLPLSRGTAAINSPWSGGGMWAPNGEGGASHSNKKIRQSSFASIGIQRKKSSSLTRRSRKSPFIFNRSAE